MASVTVGLSGAAAGSGAVSDMVTLRARIREAFEMFDKDGKGTIVDE